MDHPNAIFLIGMPAAGKSHWARVWGAQYGITALDLDVEIEGSELKTIADLFQSGEGCFREVEQEALSFIIQHKPRPFILATGGGTPCFSDNLQQMLSAGTVIYLKAGIPTLLQNLAGDSTPRPLLQGGDPASKLKALLKNRAPFYEQAHHTIRVEEATEASLDFIFAPCTDRP